MRTGRPVTGGLPHALAHRRLRRGRPSAVVLLLMLVTGCGLTPQDDPQLVTRSPLPAPAAPEPPHTTDVVQIYLVRDDRLVPVARTGRSVADALAVLSAGPTALDREADLGSRLTSRTALADLPEPDVVVVEVSPDFGGLSERDRFVAAAQLVWTATDVCCATRVRVVLDDEPIPLPTDHGPTDRPVRRADYRSVAPD